MVTQNAPKVISGAKERTQALNAYDLEGFKMVRLSRSKKKPVDAGWQERQISLEDAYAWVERGGDIGLQMGEVSGWLCAVDLDTEEARKLAPYFLPETLTAGKEGEPLPSHYVYRAPRAGFFKVPTIEGGELLSLKASNNGAGHQIAVEPSIHSSKGAYKWTGGFNPSKITGLDPGEIRRLIGCLGAAGLIARSLPSEGGRHDYAMCLAGYMVRNGENPRDVLGILKPSWAIKGALSREAERDLESIVRDTAEKLRRNEPAKGGRRLGETVQHLPERIALALGWEHADKSDGRKDYARADAGNSERLVDTYGEHIRYCYPWKCWLVWDGLRWAKDDAGEVVKMARATARKIHEDAAREPDTAEQQKISKWAIQSQNENRINAMISLARPDVAVPPDGLDADPWLLSVENGTLDLRTGELREHRPEDLITKLAPVAYDPDAQAPRFEQFLRETLKTDDLIGFVRRFAGYSLTGSTEERVFAILHGAGKNGKSTLIELLQDVLGDYAKNTDTETILQKKYAGVGNDVAALKGARFVAAAEVEQGRRLAESKVKQLTGRDTVTARFLFAEPFDFRPQFKLWLSTNNKPEIKGTDNAIWDRIRLIPFTERFEGERQDNRLPEKLREEASGVLAWMVRGCLEWQAEGLGMAESVDAATQEYREEMDTLAAFIEDVCAVHAGAQASASNLWTAYKIWCEKAGENPGTQKTFGARLKDRGFSDFRFSAGAEKGRKGWAGIGLRVNDPDPDDDGGGSKPHPKASNSSGDRSPGERSFINGSPPESRIDKRETSGMNRIGERCEAKNQKLPKHPSHVDEDLENSFTSFTSFTADESEPELTPEETRAVERLIGAGLTPEEARSEVLRLREAPGEIEI
jgi:putative DNA primase/helicase